MHHVYPVAMSPACQTVTGSASRGWEVVQWDRGNRGGVLMWGKETGKS